MRVSSREALGLRITRITDGLDCAPASVSAAWAGGGGIRAAAQLTATKAIKTGPAIPPLRPRPMAAWIHVHKKGTPRTEKAVQGAHSRTQRERVRPPGSGLVCRQPVEREMAR
jgi:hypothetical protein